MASEGFELQADVPGSEHLFSQSLDLQLLLMQVGRMPLQEELQKLVLRAHS